MTWWFRFLNWWNPIKVLVAVFGGALMIDSVSAVWGERRPVGGFFEEMIARGGHYVVVLGAFLGAIFAGAKVAERTKSNVAGWIAGISLFLVIGLAGTSILSSIPGVDWRYERLQESMENEY